MSDEFQTYKLGNFKLKSGGEIPDAFIAYKTLGDPSLPAVIYPTWYSGSEYQFALPISVRTDSDESDIRQPVAHWLREDLGPLQVLHYHSGTFRKRPIIVTI